MADDPKKDRRSATRFLLRLVGWRGARATSPSRSPREGGPSVLSEAELLERLPDLAARARVVAQGALAGIHASARRGPSAELVDRRTYVPGDDPRRIDWRVFARTRQLLVKQARRDTDLPVWLVVDASASMEFQGPRAPRSKMEHARLLAAGLAHCFLRAGDRVGLLGFGKNVQTVAPAGGGRRRLVHLAQRLEALEPGGTGDAAQALRALHPVARRRGVVVLVSDLLPPEGAELDPVYREVRALGARGHDVLVLQVRDPEEADLGALEGAFRFRDPESGSKRDAFAPDVRELYAARAGEFAARVRDLARAAAVDAALAPTDRSPAEPLAELLARRHRTGGAKKARAA